MPAPLTIGWENFLTFEVTLLFCCPLFSLSLFFSLPPHPLAFVFLNFSFSNFLIECCWEFVLRLNTLRWAGAEVRTYWEKTKLLLLFSGAVCCVHYFLKMNFARIILLELSSSPTFLFLLIPSVKIKKNRFFLDDSTTGTPRVINCFSKKIEENFFQLIRSSSPEIKYEIFGASFLEAVFYDCCITSSRCCNGKLTTSGDAVRYLLAFYDPPLYGNRQPKRLEGIDKKEVAYQKYRKNLLPPKLRKANRECSFERFLTKKLCKVNKCSPIGYDEPLT